MRISDWSSDVCSSDLNCKYRFPSQALSHPTRTSPGKNGFSMTCKIETMWEGRFITVKREGTWEYVSRSRGIEAAVLLAIDEDSDGRYILLVEKYWVPLKIKYLALPHCTNADARAAKDYAIVPAAPN